MRPHGLLVLAGAACAALLAPGRASADHERPPWTSPGDLPIADWMRSIQAQRPETAIFSVPGKLDTRRGTMTAGARLPLYGAKRGPNCRGRWLLVGPLAWVCSDGVEATPDPAWPARAPTNGAPAAWAGDGDGLPFRYYAVRSEGAFGFENLTNALDDAPSQEFDPGFIVGAVESARATASAGCGPRTIVGSRCAIWPR